MKICSAPRLAALDCADACPAPGIVDRGSAMPIRTAILAARESLLSQQRADGSWRSRREADPSLTARLVLLDSLLDRRPERCAQLAALLRESQLETGGWAATPGGEADLSISVLCYSALKLVEGIDALPALRNARRVIHRLGGAESADAETLSWLTLFGQRPPVSCCDSEANAFVRDALGAAEPIEVSPLNGIRELFVNARSAPDLPQRNRSHLPEVVELIWNRVGVGRCESDAAASLDEAIDHLCDEDFGLMPAQSPVYDTSIVLRSLLKSGLSADAPAIRSGARWLIDQLRTDSSKLSDEELSRALEALGAIAGAEQPSEDLPPSFGVCRREDSDFGGDLGQEITTASRGLIGRLTVSSGAAGPQRVLALAPWREALGDSEIDSELERLLREQAIDGGWEPSSDGRMVPQGLATSSTVLALLAAGVDETDSAVLGGVNWLLAAQAEGGGWGARDGESPSASQTAWAVEALVAAGFTTQPATAAGVDFLLETQEDTGEWREPHFLGVDPRTGRRYRNELGATCDGLSALSAWAAGGPPSPVDPPQVCLRIADFDRVGA